MSESLDNTKDLLDATQEVVIEAVDNVGQMLKSAETTVLPHPFYVSAEFWTGVAFVLTVALFFKPVKKALIVFLQKHIDRVIDRIDEAKQLKVEARGLLLEYEKKLTSVNLETEKVLDGAKKRAETLKSIKKKEMESMLSLRKKEAEDKIDAAKNSMQKEFSNQVTNRSMDMVRSTIVALSADKHSELIDKSIEAIEGLN